MAGLLCACASSAHAAPDAAPTADVFTQIVGRLQDLGYLPIARAQVYEGLDSQGRAVLRRHDAFAFPVPSTLQSIADQYAWNRSNPFIRGALTAFDRANGRIRARQYARVHFDAATLSALQAPDARPDPWTWARVLVDKRTGSGRNETLQVWQAPSGAAPGGFVFATLVSTGVLGATTSGTWPIVQRLPSTTMRGAFPRPISLAQYRRFLAPAPADAASGPTQAASPPPVGLYRGQPVRWIPYNDPGILWLTSSSP